MSSAMQARELLRYLGGGWRIERTIEDHRVGARYEFEGRARGLMVERGWLARGKESWFVRRAYRFGEENGMLTVAFEDGRPFYRIDCARLPKLEVRHECGPDLYAGAFALTPAGWTLVWRVTGPAKALTITSRYD